VRRCVGDEPATAAGGISSASLPADPARPPFPVGRPFHGAIIMSPDEHTAAIRALQSDVADIKGTLNNGLRAMVQDQRTELATVKEDIQQIRDALTGHVAKEDVIYEIFKRVMNTGVTITGALIALLLSIIGYLLVHPAGLH
jgi:hypothetical protein